MSEFAYITPKVLKWARESAKMSVDTAAGKVSVSVERFREWEEGSAFPTIRQAEKLANAYKRPFAVFFLPEIPDDFQTLRDFRKKGSKVLGTASIFIMREIQQKQAWISDYNKENGEVQASFVGRFSIKDDPKVVAKDILNTLGIDPLHYSSTKPLKEWLLKAEENGIFISRTSFIHSRLKLDSEEIQGFAIADPYAPFVFINSDDWDAPQLFTMVHELAHLWIAESGISNDIQPDLKAKDKYDPVELFSNKVAANALMPSEFIIKNKNAFEDTKHIFELAKRLGISSLALLVKAYNLRLIPYDLYKDLKDTIEVEFQAFLKLEEEKQAKKKEEGRKTIVNSYLLQLNRNSRLFTQLILDFFRSGEVEPTLASNLLNVKSNKFSKLEDILYK